MFFVGNYALAVAFCVVTMLCWGSWGNTQKLASNDKWKHQLFYWDYGIGILLSSLLLVIAIDWAGLAVAFPIGIGLALVLGVVQTYWFNPKGDPYCCSRAWPSWRWPLFSTRWPIRSLSRRRWVVHRRAAPVWASRFP